MRTKAALQKLFCLLAALTLMLVGTACTNSGQTTHAAASTGSPNGTTSVPSGSGSIAPLGAGPAGSQ